MKYDVFGIFSEDIQEYDIMRCDADFKALQSEIDKLNALGLGKLWPLSGRKASLGFLIYGVKESLLNEVLIVLNRQSSVKFADALPGRVNPSEPRSSCGLKKDK